MRQRGLTLIEVLAATVLLAIMAATVAPLLAESLSVLHEKTSGIDVVDVGLLADAFLEDPATFGVEDLDTIIMSGSFELPWPEELQVDRDAVRVNVLRAESTNEPSEDEYFWLVFACGEAATMRWYLIELDSGGESEGEVMP